MTESAKRFAGKTALVTGAGGAIGGAIAHRLYSEGARIVASDVAIDRLQSLQKELPEIAVVAADVATVHGATAAVAAAGECVDILSNNAGISDGGGTLDELDDQTWSRVIEVNLTSAFLLSRRVIGGMLAAGTGVIVNMSSVAGLRGGRTGIAYTASKWGLIGMTQNIAASLGPEGIRAYALCPGAVTGAVTLGVVARTRRAARNATRDSGRHEPTTPADVANVVAFLASDEARHLNGTAIPIDHGWLAY